MSKVTVVLDSMAGSCGKGKFIGYLAQHDNYNVAVDNFMTNAGHTYVTNGGVKIMTQHVPTSMVNPETELVMQSLLPINESFKRYKNLDGKTAQIPEINTRLAALAKEKGLKFINLFPLFVEPGTNVLRKELTTDGLHLNDEGYKIWVKAIKQAK